MLKQNRSAWIEAVRAADADLGASESVEARLRSELRSMGRARRRSRVLSLGLAASLTMAVAATMWLGRMPPSDRAPVVAHAEEVRTGFFPLFYASVPTRTTQIVRLEVPRAALRSFGLAAMDVVSVSESGTVTADVVIGEDGLARAVRFVHSPISQE